jgi:thioredoxin reductase (NADPH)
VKRLPHKLEYVTESFDTVVVGAGPTGLACGIELQQRGVRAVLLEKGCVVNSIYHYPTHMTFFTTPELLEIGDLPMTSLNDKPNRTEALKYYRRVADHYRLDIRQYERVDSIAGEDNAFQVCTTDRLERRHVYQARKMVISTGYYDIPNRLGVPGEELDKVIHYYKEAHPYYNHDVAVIGGKNSAAIAALELYWTGARVTLIHREAGVSDGVKYWIKPNLENRIRNGEIRAYFHSRVVEIGKEYLRVATPEGEMSLRNDFVFAMIGYRPDLDFLNSIGISLEPDTLRPRTDPETLESERPGIYLAGVIVAGMHTNEIFIENGRFHGRLIAQSIASKLLAG